MILFSIGLIAFVLGLLIGLASMVAPEAVGDGALLFSVYLLTAGVALALFALVGVLVSA